MTIKPVLSQKSAKHEKSDIQDGQSASLASSSVRPAHRGCISHQTLAKSPSPQRETKTPNSRSHVYDVNGAGNIGVSGSRRRRSPQKRIHKRDCGGRIDQREKLCKSPQYQVERTASPCSSPHSNSGKSPKSTHGSITGVLALGSNSSNNNNNNVTNVLEDSFSGYNSGDEHIGQKDASLSMEEWEQRDKNFIKMMSDRGFAVNEIVEDGACLFRSISLQIYGDQDMHEVIREQTMDYILKNQEYFAQFVTEEISSYVSRKRNSHVHGNHIEIQAISEIYNRPVELYCYQAEPTNIFNSDQIKQGYEPFRLSYQRGSHYNAILNPYKGSVGVGLGLAGYRPEEPDLKQIHDAVRLSEDLEIEQTMFEDKLKTTDWEATNEAIEEQIARESYLQWCRDNKHATLQQKPIASSSSTVTSSDIGGNSSNKSPSFSGDDESEEFTPYPSDDERCNDYSGAGSSSTAMHSENIYYAKQPQHPRQQQKRRKRRRGTESTGAGSGSSASGSSSAGPSTITPSMSSTKGNTPTSSMEEYQRLSPKSVKLHSRSNDAQNEEAGPSKPKDKPTSTFYHELLESSYSDDFFDVGQLSEEKMLQKALQMSRMDFMQKLHKTDSDPPSP